MQGIPKNEILFFKKSDITEVPNWTWIYILITLNNLRILNRFRSQAYCFSSEAFNPLDTSASL